MSFSHWEEMAHSLAAKKWWTHDGVVSLSVCELLLKQAQTLAKESRFRKARIGKGIQKKLVMEIRRDEIYWIEDWDSCHFSSYGEILESIKQALRFHLFLPIKRFEGHLAFYRKGAFYLKHIDRHSVQPHRLITCVLYLNDVSPEKGGELVLYGPSQEQTFIHPKKGRLVVFDSEMSHEVKTTQQNRWSLTSWMREDVL